MSTVQNNSSRKHSFSKKPRKPRPLSPLTPILYSPSFARIKRPRWWPIELNDRHLRSHGKIGDCEQSTPINTQEIYENKKITQTDLLSKCSSAQASYPIPACSLRLPECAAIASRQRTPGVRHFIRGIVRKVQQITGFSAIFGSLQEK